MLRSLILLLLTCFAAAVGAHAQTSDSLSLTQLLRNAEAHPMLRMKAAALEASRNRIAMKSTLMNPMLMVGVQGLPTDFKFNEEPMTGKVIGVTQDFPYPGKLASERDIAAQDTVTKAFDIQEQQNALDREIKLAYFDIYHLEKSNEAYEHHVRVLDDLIQAAEARLAANRGTEQDVIGLKLEQSTTKSQIIEGKSMIAMRVADLMEASDTRVAPDAVVGRLTMPEFTYTISELDSIAAHDRPLLASVRSEAVQSGLQASRSGLEAYPDFSVSLMYMQRDALAANSPMNPTNTDAARMLGMDAMPMSQPDLLSATLSVSLPINSTARHQAIGEAEAMRSMKESEAASTLLTIHAQLVANLARLESLREQEKLLKSEILPLVSASEETSNANLAAGKATIEDVLRSTITQLHREHDLFQIEAEYNKTIATIEYLVGRSLVSQ
jgi:outer membrane protein TolC